MSDDFQWRQDVLAKLNEAGELYNKSLTSGQVSVWIRALTGRSTESIEQAFDAHYQTSKYMPKPAEICKIIQSNHLASVEQPHDVNPQWIPAPEHISTAYRVYLKAAYGFDFLGDQSPMSLEKALEIVNKHMAERGRWLDIEPDFRLSGYETINEKAA